MIETGIYFGDIHSYYDLGLVLSSVDIPPATPKTNYIDIPGGDGSIDLTEVHGDVKYNDRECKFTFSVAKSINESDWEELKTNVNNALNGKTFKITLDKDADYYYLGRCSINEYAVNKRIRQIIVNARVAPWKYRQSKTVVMLDISNDAKTVYLGNGRKPVCPIVETTSEETYIVRVPSDGFVYIFERPGIHKNLDFQLKDGVNVVKIWALSSGTVKITYQEGDL